MARLNKRRAAALLEQAELHGRRGEWAQVAELTAQVARESALSSPKPFAMLAEAHQRLGRLEESWQVLAEGLAKHPADPELTARTASMAAQRGDAKRAVELFSKVRSTIKREPTYRTHFAAALLQLDRLDEAEAELAAALLTGGGLETRLVLAAAKGRRGHLEEAAALAAQVEAQADEPQLKASALAMVADAKLMLGEPAAALEVWRRLEAQGALDPAQLGHMAYAAQLVGEAGLADELIGRRRALGPTAEDLLLFAQIANLRGRPLEALELLARAPQAPGHRFPGWEYELSATRGRALRLAGRAVEAKAELLAALERPEASTRRLGPGVHVDLGHLAAEEGVFEEAEQHFARALELDPAEPEAARARAVNARRIGWRQDLAASAEAQVEAAKAEAEALRRRFLSRESEVDALRRELEQLKKQKGSAEVQARRAAEEAAARAKDQLRAELEARDLEVEAKALANLELALGDQRARCPDAIWSMLVVAERTFQKALYTELPAAAVAVLYSGALERSLYLLLVSTFDDWLEAKGARAAFLAGAVRERRGRKAEYFDRFVEAFDREAGSKAPALGEVQRVLERRREPYLQAFREFLAARFGLGERFFDELALFVRWSKETLRDPVAHGQAVALGYDELRRFREQLLFSFGGAAGGVLPQLLRAQR